jgi:hypothetical protein
MKSLAKIVKAIVYTASAMFLLSVGYPCVMAVLGSLVTTLLEVACVGAFVFLVLKATQWSESIHRADVLRTRF